MGLIRKVLIGILTLSLVVFCALFGSLPRFRKTPLGYANRFIWISLPSTLLAVDRFLTGGRASRNLKRVGRYLMWENHPFVLIFYLSIVFGAQAIFTYGAWSRLTTFQRVASSILIAIPYYCTYKTVSSTSSVITEANHAVAMRQYPFDYVLFYPGQICQTCKIPKPARSKHCRMCNNCTAKHDHHCLWVMNCISRDNYVWFLSMVASLGSMLVYGVYLAYSLISAELAAKLVPWPQELSIRQRFDMWFEGVAADPNVGCTGLLAALTSPLAWFLLAYHMYLIWAGMTTSESFKWDEWRDDVADGYVYRRTSSEPRERGMPKLRMTQHEHTRDINPDVWSTLKPFDLDDLDPQVSWPATSRTILINTAHRASSDQESGADLSKAPWSRMKSLAEAANIYDLGFVENLWDAVRWARR